MTLQKLQTKKLFYGRWPYKVSTRIQGAAYIRYRGFDNLHNLVKAKDAITGILATDMERYLDRLAPYVNDIQLRIEHYTVNMFCENRTMYDRLCRDFEPWLESITEPASDDDLAVLLNRKKIILCNELPEGQYQYRVSFKTMPPDTKNTLGTWASNNCPDRIGISNTNKEQFDRHWPWANIWLYVKDSPTLTMLALVSQGYISKVEEYIPRSSINIIS